jgi:hypothetical protein
VAATGFEPINKGVETKNLNHHTGGYYNIQVDVAPE